MLNDHFYSNNNLVITRTSSVGVSYYITYYIIESRDRTKREQNGGKISHTHTYIHTGLHWLQIPSQRDCMQNPNNIFKITQLHKYCKQQSIKKPISLPHDCLKVKVKVEWVKKNTQAIKEQEGLPGELRSKSTTHMQQLISACFSVHPWLGSRINWRRDRVLLLRLKECHLNPCSQWLKIGLQYVTSDDAQVLHLSTILAAFKKRQTKYTPLPNRAGKERPGSLLKVKWYGVGVGGNKTHNLVA